MKNSNVKKLRKRIRRTVDATKVTIEKVDLSRFFTPKVPKRSKMAAMTKKEILLSFEVRDMFRNLSVSTILDDKREASVMRHETFSLNKVKVVDTITPVEKTVVVPTAYDIVHDAVLGTYRKGKNFVKHTVQTVDVIPTLDWNHFSFPTIAD
jgi:hypothetical protein